MKKPFLAVTGLSGLIGSQITSILNKYYHLISISQENVDIRKEKNVNRFLKSIYFDYFLHLAAYTNVDKSEEEKNIAYDINVKGTYNLISNIDVEKIPFIYISTDFVFDGKKPPYYESSVPNPINYYGKTKLLGEKFIEDKGIIARISYPFGKRSKIKKDIVHTMSDLIKRDVPIKAIQDNLITLTYIEDIAYNIHTLFKDKIKRGVFHLTGNKSVSSFDLFSKISKILNINTKILPVSFNEYYKNKVPRAQYGEIKSIHNNMFKYSDLDSMLSKVLLE